MNYTYQIKRSDGYFLPWSYDTRAKANKALKVLKGDKRYTYELIRTP